ncbi:hypothetical protein C8250_042095 [Streptomyces sp. So13.3]|uniref:hypothetical protein n=1 Tax=Streptomyces TaxID=1883 RepID=UPI0011059373|nr:MULTISPECIES: hypothetical protein [Streptomyces]QNA77517.1 hypothetical protein C8250_042095 [Streptomyces sp. So13.3]
MEPAAGTVAAARAALLAAYYEARDNGDAELMAAAALRLPSSQYFGTHPGHVPALIHEAYTVAVEPASRCRLAAALARAWAYGGETQRAVAFAREAVALADRLGDPEVVADALDAALLASWGPDDFAERLALSARLADAAAHLTEPAQRLTAHLWRLTTAWECLDVVAVQRQLRALDMIAEESGSARAAFFAASRRAMYALATGDIDTADRLIPITHDLGGQAAEPDREAVVHSLVAARARHVGDAETLRSEAAAFEAYGSSEGVPSVSAEAAVFWLAADEPNRAEQLLHQLAGAGLATVPRDVDFLLTVTSLVDVAAALHSDEIVADGARLLEPFAGRAVLNAGAVTFHGVVDDYLHRAEQVLGRPDTTRWRHNAASAYQRIGAAWWRDRLIAPAAATPTTPPVTVHLHRDGELGWVVGTNGTTIVLSDLKGLFYLRELLRSPGVELSVLDLSAAAPGHAGVVTESDTAEIIDKQALVAYHHRLRDIDAELDEAESWTDHARLDRLRLEREALLAEVRTATGLGGRRRRFTSAHERARIAVRKAIASTLDRIDHHDAQLARLLRDTIHTGASCRYDPDPSRPVSWLLDTPKSEE